MYPVIKRVFDLFFSIIWLVILAPVLLIVMAVLKLTGEGEVFFNQPRVGLDSKEIKVHKFVTMRIGSEKVSTITERGDPRVLPFGRFLRATKINELPQLLNILKGQMSFVGPRPLSRYNFDTYPDDAKPLIYRGVKPGLTGIGSVLFRNEEELMSNTGKTKERAYSEDIMPIKAQAELWYREHRGFLVDCAIIMLTAISLFFSVRKLIFSVFKSLPVKDQYFRLCNLAQEKNK